MDYLYSMDSQTGKYLMAAGALLLLTGLLIYFFHDRLGWIGRLPGDIRIERDSFRFYFPVTTMILFSLLVSAVIFILRRFF